MSEKMRPLSFDALMRRALWEYRERGSVFGVKNIYRHESGKTLPIFAEHIETPFGPAAGPHTQLAQNLVAAYAGGCRFFELKTVQKLDGDDLPVEKPCILARAEGYNVEWSTELTVPQATEEYIKAFFAMKLLSRALGLGGDTGFVFNASVGYDLAGIQSPKIDAFLESLKDASQTACFQACADWALSHLKDLPGVDAAFVRAISPRVCTSVTLSTLHGCPAGEIERIASYLIEKKGLHTFVKCNPTLLGYEFARKTLDEMGYADLVFDDHHFKEDLQFTDAVPMFARLEALADKKGLTFGLKLTNTFPVQIARGELPGNEMYMSGRALYPLTLALTRKIEDAFDGRMRVSFSGGADAFNIGRLFDCGIWPVTMATTFLKPGGYERMRPIAQTLSQRDYAPFAGVNLEKLAALVAESTSDPHHTKDPRAPEMRKTNDHAPLTDCFIAPCETGCPIHQDIAAYLDLAEAGDCEGALRVICEKNPLPFITGTICPHTCQSRCTRHFYEDAVHIRAVKRLVAQRGMDAYVKTLRAPAPRPERVAVIGGGPGGMAAAFFAARAGARVTLFEKRAALGGVVRYAIPAFRIENEAVEGDTKLLAALGVDVRLNTEIRDAASLFEKGYTHVVLAPGAWEARAGAPGVPALAFLEAVKADPEAYAGAKRAVIVGGGNTAMDAARAALRIPGVESVTVAYRRTRAQMPADWEEQETALLEGARFWELRSPARCENGQLTLAVMALGDADASGRARPMPTGEAETRPCDLLIDATGTAADADFLRACGAGENERVWVVGDAKDGPATVVQAIASARAAVDAMLHLEPPARICARGEGANRGELRDFGSAQTEPLRCLHCGEKCLVCAQVCPNRANIEVTVAGRAQVVHIDDWCNECGNCEAFCPHGGAPLREKLTLFSRRADFDADERPGMLPLDNGRARVRISGQTFEDGADFAHADPAYRELLKEALKLALALR